jgi:uncharacterized protein YggE
VRSANLLVASFLVACAAPAFGQGKRPDPPKGAILKVKGESVTEVKPDYALFTAVVATAAGTLEAAVDAHGDRATRAVGLIESLRPDGLDLKSSGFDLRETTRLPASLPSSPPPPAPEPQFTATTTFRIKVKPISGINASLSKLVASGLVQVRSVSFEVERVRSALNEARRLAMQDAREQAEVYAGAGPFRLVEMAEVADGDAAPAGGEDSGAADLPQRRSPFGSIQIVPPATLSFRASVNVTWRIAPR